jgi:Tfp pilus assembly protein FimT
MIVVAIVGVIGALAAPNLVPMLRKNRLFGQGETVAAFLDATRRRAVGDSRCYRVIPNGAALLAQRRTVGDCANLDDTNWVDVQTLVSEASNIGFTLESLSQATVPAQNFHIVFRPNGRLVGNGDLNFASTDDGARIVVADSEMTDSARLVVITSNGRICHQSVSGAVPALGPSVTCP